METPDYADMSLDEVIRIMKAKKTQKEMDQSEFVSPMLREDNEKPTLRQWAFQAQPQTLYPKHKYSNYLKHMARKRVRQAVSTQNDLRRKLIHNRSYNGLDLRWKLIALVVARLRAKYAPYYERSQRIQPYLRPPPQPCNNHLYQPCNEQLVPPNAPPANGLKMRIRPPVRRPPMVQPEVMARIEELVGKLPPWMTQSNGMTPTIQYSSGGDFPCEDEGPGPLIYAPPSELPDRINQLPAKTRALVEQGSTLTFYPRAVPFSCTPAIPRLPELDPNRDDMSVDDGPPPLQPAPPIPVASSRPTPSLALSLPINVRKAKAVGLLSGSSSLPTEATPTPVTSPLQRTCLGIGSEALIRENMKDVVIQLENPDANHKPRSLTLHERFSQAP